MRRCRQLVAAPLRDLNQLRLILDGKYRNVLQVSDRRSQWISKLNYPTLSVHLLLFWFNKVIWHLVSEFKSAYLLYSQCDPSQISQSSSIEVCHNFGYGVARKIFFTAELLSDFECYLECGNAKPFAWFSKSYSLQCSQTVAPMASNFSRIVSCPVLLFLRAG